MRDFPVELNGFSLLDIKGKPPQAIIAIKINVQEHELLLSYDCGKRRIIGTTRPYQLLPDELDLEYVAKEIDRYFQETQPINLAEFIADRLKDLAVEGRQLFFDTLRKEWCLDCCNEKPAGRYCQCQNDE